MHSTSGPVSLVASSLLIVASGQTLYQPCPLLRAYYPGPTLDKDSETVKSFTQEFTGVFDDLIASGGRDDFGAITPNTTSFSVVLFSGADSAEADPVFFEYHYTATALNGTSNVSAQTVFPVGGLTQLFTVYTWLVEAGDESWESPITEFLPELSNANATTSSSEYDIGLTVDWDSVTVGSLASHMSGLVRDSNACSIFEDCDKQKFLDAIFSSVPYFLPDTTPIISNAAFQLLAYAIESKTGRSFSDALSSSVLDALNMTQTGLLSPSTAVFGGQPPKNFTSSGAGDPAAQSLYASTADLAKAGHAMLSSALLAPSQTRRWLSQPAADTSNLRNGVGRPWEIYHAGRLANSSILDVYTKTGSIGRWSSYFGLAPDFGAGFAILAHDADTPGAPDLNVYADVVSLALVALEGAAAAEMAARYAGEFVSDGAKAVLDVADGGPGLVVEELVVAGLDVRGEAAARLEVEVGSLDFRLYPSNVVSGGLQQFVAVFQDRNAPADMGTPTCITWMDVGALEGIPVRFVFEMGDGGVAVGLRIPDRRARLDRA
ncbi:beta-lactamase/transpeptidase-like protein [Truncatella angustata]|uniref:Beta-lactamase/transpeptidase-like protein n=1 Tax=Truncatella angustata TaxID=152316 RepID=A0A9P8RG47_9PEZI|nr:beta-lactamase/transpeptidase-like protein [Truncatella angustata]KAH6645383.1 beta-lactamase/transpeptidase-like protein [Truncatella angustata]